MSTLLLLNLITPTPFSLITKKPKPVPLKNTGTFWSQKRSRIHLKANQRTGKTVSKLLTQKTLSQLTSTSLNTFPTQKQRSLMLDDETDGEWEPSQIDNPEYKGEWTPKEIPNPDYKGPWVHPMIANPEHGEDSQLYSYEDFGVIGLDLWQVKSGTVFSNFLITDDVENAKAACQEVLDTTVKGALAMKEEVEEANRKIEEEADEDDDESIGEIDDDEEDNVVEASPEVAAEVTPEVAAEEPAAATGKDEL